MKKYLLTAVGIAVLIGGWSVTAPSMLAQRTPVAETASGQHITLPPLNSSHFLLVDWNQQQILAQKGAQERIYPASLTKLMTVYTALQHLDDLHHGVTIPEGTKERFAIEGAATVGFNDGEWVSVRDLLYGTMLASGADAVSALTVAVAGSEEAFVEMMNEEAARIGMKHTHFTNATGLHYDHLYTTLSDLYKLMQVAMQDEDFRIIFTTREYMAYPGQHLDGLLIESTLFRNLTADTVIQGGKTGYTEEAGQALVSLAHIDNNAYLLLTAGADGNPEYQDTKHIDDAITVYQMLQQP